LIKSEASLRKELKDEIGKRESLQKNIERLNSEVSFREEVGNRFLFRYRPKPLLFIAYNIPLFGFDYQRV